MVGTLLVLKFTGLLTQDSEPAGTILVDAYNGYNKLSRLLMLWVVRHRCQAGARFAFNCFRHWSQLLFCKPSDAPVILLSREGFSQGDFISMVLYGITLVLLIEDLRDADPTLHSPFYADDTAFDGSARRSTAQLKILMDLGPDQGYIPEPAKSLFIADNL